MSTTHDHHIHCDSCKLPFEPHKINRAGYLNVPLCKKCMTTLKNDVDSMLLYGYADDLPKEPSMDTPKDPTNYPSQLKIGDFVQTSYGKGIVTNKWRSNIGLLYNVKIENGSEYRFRRSALKYTREGGKDV